MNIIRKRQQVARNYHSDWYEELRLEEVAAFHCGICGDRWPASMKLVEDGKPRCPDCSANGLTEEDKAAILQFDAARMAERQTRPQEDTWRPNVTPTGTITNMTVSGVRAWQGAPIYLAAGGASKDIVATGVNLTSSDTCTATTGITAVAVRDSATQVTITVSADGGTAPGDYYHLTYNGTTYRGLFRVR